MAPNDFLDLVRRSQLVEDELLNKFLGELAARNGRKLPDSDEKVAAAMVAASLITDWQAEKLLAGKHKGFLLGKYKLLRHLGKGGMSQVYLAEHLLMKRKVAIKVLPKNRVEDTTYLERFRIEARAAAKLDDPHIVRVYDIDEHEGTHFIVMEYVEGQDLHVHVKENGPLPFEKSADYIAQVARGLQHAHEMGLVHRDIKPANCMLDKNETVKLLDMGLARLVDDEASLTLDNNENVLGTADYLAPEQALNSHKADTRADVYSLGCTFYFLLTGHPPFPEGTISERLLKHQVEQAPSIFKDRPDAPSVLVNICNRMMAKRPEDRYQTSGEVGERLGEWLRDRGLDVGDSTKRLGTASGSGGIGSDVFRRFAASMQKASGESTRPGKGTVRKPTTATPTKEPEPDLGLAPLEEETIDKKVGDTAVQKLLPKPAASPIEPLPGATARTKSDSGPALTPGPAKPRRSLIEEELEPSQAMKSDVSRRQSMDDFNPLRPPGYSGPSYGPPTWVFVAIAVGIVAVVGIVIAVLASSGGG